MDQVEVLPDSATESGTNGVSVLYDFTKSQLKLIFEAWKERAEEAGIQLPYCPRKEESEKELFSCMKTVILRTAISLISNMPRSLKKKGKATICFKKKSNTAIGIWQGVKRADDIDLRLTFEVMIAGDISGTAATLLADLYIEKLFSGEFSYINLERDSASDEDTLILNWTKPVLEERVARVERLLAQ